MSLIQQIRLKSASSPGQPSLVIPAAPITLIVGPNNSGKSLLLNELNLSLREDRPSTEFSVLANIDFDAVCLPVCVADIQSHRARSFNGNKCGPNNVYYVKAGERSEFHEPDLNQWLASPTLGTHHFKAYAKFNTIKLDGPNRIALINEKELRDLTEPPTNRLEQLFQNDDIRKELRKVIYDALESYLVLDPTHMGRVRVRLSEKEPQNLIQEKGIHPEAVAFHKDALKIDQASDGIKAFCGILIELYAGDPQVLLIDEPEAFLHPSLAYMLGKTASAKAQATGKQLIIATHSANFLMGCIQSGAHVNVVRLTYSNQIATARLLPSAELIKSMRNPLLRSAGVLNGLFYDGVVVTESDTDRAFYNEINERLLLDGNGRGRRNCLFLNAQNKQTVRVIISLLRSLGIPAAGIVDIDILKEGGTVWTNFLKSGGVPDASIHAHALTRANLKAKLEQTSKDMKRYGGINLLTTEDLQAANDLLDALDGYGLFVVRGGEVESWLKGYGIAGHGADWLIPMFEKLGEDPSDTAYVKAATGDVWDFIQKVSD